MSTIVPFQARSRSHRSSAGTADILPFTKEIPEHWSYSEECFYRHLRDSHGLGSEAAREEVELDVEARRFAETMPTRKEGALSLARNAMLLMKRLQNSVSDRRSFEVLKRPLIDN